MSKIIFPRPFAIAIDDLGWINGHNEGEAGYGPYRLGVRRKMRVKDYEAVADLAKKVGVRLQGLFILGEMDRENFLGDYPTTTHLRETWDNTENISDLQLEMMEYVRKEAAHIEFGLHGIGHEFWPEEGKRRRAEWYNTVDNHPWPEEQIRIHLDCFVRIMKQYGLSKDNGHSFPESFVPCAYSYYWNPDGGDYSLGKLLGEYGVQFANTDFTQIPECNPPSEPNGGGFDHAVHVMNRYNYGNLWYELGKTPVVPLDEQPTDYIETHWPNLLAQDDFLQEEITEKWRAYYQAVQASSNRYCAKNTAQMHSQWLYNTYAKVSEKRTGTVEIDNTQMPAEAYRGNFPANLVLKIALSEGEHVSSAKINGASIPAYLEDQGYAFLYLPPLLQDKYTLEYETGPQQIQDVVWHDSTANIFEVSQKEQETKIDLCLYGEQEINFINSKLPEEVMSNNPGIEVLDWQIKNNLLSIRLAAHDIQGEIGSVRIIY